MKHALWKHICPVLLAAWLMLGAAGAAAQGTYHGLTNLNVAAVASEDANLSPLTSRDRDMHSLMALCYEGLVKLDKDGRPEKNLAESWDAPGGSGKRWTFHLRQGITFHNGKELTAADVVATLNRILELGQYDEKRASSLPREERGVYANLMEAYVSEWTALDDYTVQITGARGYYGMLNAMTFPILPAEEVNNALPSGTGPYRIAEYEPGDKLWLTAFPGYRTPVANVSNIVATLYPNTDKALEAFDAGVVDVAMTRSISATRYTGSLRSFSMLYSTNQVELLMMHHKEKKGILRDDTVRRAIMAAIDRAALIRQSYQGMATLADTPVPPGSWLYDGSATQEPYSPAKANEMLEQADWKLNVAGVREKFIDGTPTPLKLSLLTYEEPTGGVRQSTANAIAEMLRVVGIDCTVTVNSYGWVKERLSKGNFDLVLCGMNLDVVPDPGFMLLSVGTNYSRYRSDTMSELIKNMRAQTDGIQYQAAMSEVQQQFVADAPFMCLFFRNGVLITRDTFSDEQVLRELELFRGIEAW